MSWSAKEGTMRHFTVLVVLFAVVMGASAPVFAQSQTALVPPTDSPVGEWILASGELVTFTIAVNGAVSGTHIAQDFSDGAVDRHAVIGTFDGRELRLAIVGTSHPGYVLRLTGPDTFRGQIVDIPGGVIFNRRLPFAGQDPT